jgi:SAM-dependent MidA family methyltransferase
VSSSREGRAQRRSSASSSPTRSSTPSRPPRRRRDGALREVLVGSRDGAFVDVEADPTTPALAARLTEESIQLVEGQRAEISLGLGAWVDAASAGLERGVLLLIDYGYPAAELYDPLRRRDGTLRAYLRHRVHDDPYVHVGRQDLTAHVDVTAVESAARAAGLDHLGTTTQAEFLVGLGTEDLLRAIQADPRRRSKATSPSARRSCACSIPVRWGDSG